MNGDIFRQWFKQEFVPAVEKYLAENNLPRKAILILDNAPCHPANEELQDGDIKALFLPANVTSLCQPMDQGILEALQKKYRHRLLTTLITSVDNDEDCIERLKKVDLVDVIIWLSEAWNEMSSLSLVRSWKILLEHEASHKWKEPPKETDNETTNKDTQLISLLKQMPGCESADQEDIQEWMGNDDEEEFTEDDIVEMVTNEANETY